MKYNLSLVNYINTYPFLEALKQADFPFNVSEKIPRLCGEDFIKGTADIALIPCGFLPRLDGLSYKILNQYGIACDGPVRTVKLLSKKPLKQINNIGLDSHSTSSSQLLKILCEHHWGISPEFNSINISDVQNIDAALMIGDKVFEYESGFEYAYDLGTVWKEFTGLPFVFAIWIAKSEVPEEILDILNTQFERGLSTLDQTIDKFESKFPTIDVKTYLGTNIHFKLDERYIDGLQKYLSFLNVKKLV